jgi:hypothetical protein
MRTWRKKHRLVLEVTTNKPMTESMAKNATDLLLERLDKRKPIWGAGDGTFVLKVKANRFSRVLQSEMNKRRKPSR